ncbi:hypothetical protein NC651_011870 [Populus alba x Populus x berolinensis]|nr:hypothetical protein NC651_011870 [Populus alba x Populus x berolinensis]
MGGVSLISAWTHNLQLHSNVILLISKISLHRKTCLADCRSHGVPLLINDRIDDASDATGVHACSLTCLLDQLPVRFNDNLKPIWDPEATSLVSIFKVAPNSVS